MSRFCTQTVTNMKVGGTMISEMALERLSIQMVTRLKAIGPTDAGTVKAHSPLKMALLTLASGLLIELLSSIKCSGMHRRLRVTEKSSSVCLFRQQISTVVIGATENPMGAA